jgi:hypothetical protein
MSEQSIPETPPVEETHDTRPEAPADASAHAPEAPADASAHAPETPTVDTPQMVGHPIDPVVLQRMHPDDLSALGAQIAKLIPKPSTSSPAEPAPAEPAPEYSKGTLVRFRYEGHNGPVEQFGVTIADTVDGLSPVAWFTGRSGGIPTEQLEPFQPED